MDVVKVLISSSVAFPFGQYTAHASITPRFCTYILKPTFAIEGVFFLLSNSGCRLFLIRMATPPPDFAILSSLNSE